MQIKNVRRFCRLPPPAPCVGVLFDFLHERPLRVDRSPLTAANLSRLSGAMDRTRARINELQLSRLSRALYDATMRIN
jgi:hypothetical protein